MTSVNLPVDRGGDGQTYSDDADPNTGLDNYGYITRWMKLIAAVMGVANWIKTQADTVAANVVAAAASASSALNAPGTNATSTTSLTVGTGTKNLTLAQTGKAYSAGQTVVIASTASPGNQMTGVITSFTSGTGVMVVDAQQVLGSGTFAAWTISLGALVSSTLPSQTGNTGKALFTNGTSASWMAAIVPANNGSDFADIPTVRTNLGLVIGTHVQAQDAGLASIAGLTTAANKMIYTTAMDTYAVADLSPFARTILDDVDAPAVRMTIGAQASHANLSAFSSVTGAANKLFYFTGSGAGTLTDLSAFARTLLDDVDAAAGRLTLSAAKSGANNDITQLTGLTTALSASQGGTGVASLALLLAALPITGGLTGELRLGNLYLKWGQTTVTAATSGTGGEATVNFAALGLGNFPTGCAGAWHIPDFDSGGAKSGTNYGAYVRNRATTGFTLGLDSSGTPNDACTCCWIAIGY